VIADRWGVSAAEVARSYPCDAVVPRPAVQAWRGVSIAAAPSTVWPWVVQIRLAPYSYDWLDNLGRRSPQELRRLGDPQPGQNFTTAIGRPMGEVLSVDPGVQLTGRIAGAVLSYLVVPQNGSTRLLLKIVMAGFRAAAPIITVGDLVMARRQLLNLKRLAEKTGGIPDPAVRGVRSG
jgi:hypothetical protein